MSIRYQPRTPAVVHEIFDDEVVIVNLDSGDYYSLSEAGVECWACVIAGCSIDETVESLMSKYSGDRELIRQSVINLFEQLDKEKLVICSDNVEDAEDAGNASSDLQVGDSDDEKPGFVEPLLTPYSDMRDLLLIDPIHEVDEAGWPEANQPDTGPAKEQA